MYYEHNKHGDFFQSILGDGFKSELDLCAETRHYRFRAYLDFHFQRYNLEAAKNAHEFIAEKAELIISAIKGTKPYRDLQSDLSEAADVFNKRIHNLEQENNKLSDRIKEIQKYQYNYELNYKMKHGEDNGTD